jgi:hypothetical protein
LASKWTPSRMGTRTCSVFSNDTGEAASSAAPKQSNAVIFTGKYSAVTRALSKKN